MQRLVAKPEHNGKRARVLSFDARTGRYAVSLEDGKDRGSAVAQGRVRGTCSGWLRGGGMRVGGGTGKQRVLSEE